MRLKKHGYHTYDNTGWPAPCEVVYSATGGAEPELAPPGEHKHIMILGASTKYDVKIREDHNGVTTSGPIRAHVPGDADGLRFPGALDMGENKGVYLESTSSGNVTLYYYIYDDSLD